MARKKRESHVLAAADKRLAGLISINPSLVLKNGVGVASLKAKRDTLKADLDSYNTLLSNIDAALNRVQAGEVALREESSRALKGVENDFGNDSDEYEKAGGVRKSERKKRARKPKPPKPPKRPRKNPEPPKA